MAIPSDDYYKRSEISNSTLTALFYRLYPQLNFVSEEAKQKAFHLGTLVDALITEPDKINFYQLTVDEEQYEESEFKWGRKMKDALFRQAKKDKFLDYVLKNAETQKVMVHQSVGFEQGCFKFSLPCRCKWDWWLGDHVGFGGDLKTTSATTYNGFLQQYKDIWLRGRVFYNELAHAINPAWGNKDFVFAISKVNQKVFFLKLERDDELYKEGLSKLSELAFKAWMLMI